MFPCSGTSGARWIHADPLDLARLYHVLDLLPDLVIEEVVTRVQKLRLRNVDGVRPPPEGFQLFLE